MRIVLGAPPYCVRAVLTTGARPDIERLMLLLIATVALDGYAILAVVTSRKRATA